MTSTISVPIGTNDSVPRCPQGCLPPRQLDLRHLRCALQRCIWRQSVRAFHGCALPQRRGRSFVVRLPGCHSCLPFVHPLRGNAAEPRGPRRSRGRRLLNVARVPDLANADGLQPDNYQPTGPFTSKKLPLGPSASSVVARTTTFAPSDGCCAPGLLFISVALDPGHTELTLIGKFLRRGLAALLVATSQPNGKTLLRELS